MTAIAKILVVRLSSIGDIILTTPLLRSLKTTYPDTRITFLIKKQFADLLALSPYVDELITFDSNTGFAGLRKLKKVLKSRHFDLYLDIHKNWRSRYLRLGLGAGKTTTYHKLILKRTLLIWFKINLYKHIKPVYERYFDSVRHLGIQYDGKGTGIHIADDHITRVRELLLESGYRFDSPLVIICPGATYTNKCWRSEGFIETGRYLISQKSAFVVVHGGTADEDRCTQIAATLGNKSVSLAGRLTLPESAALLRLSNLVIANDSGLLHLAQSQKRPVIGIYGPTTRELGYFPVAQDATVIEIPLSCRPCTHNGLNTCPKKHFRCMNDISADKIIQASLHYIN